jgi:PhnB protein
MAVSGILIQPYLFFAGRTEEALAFYKTALGAHVEMVMKFNQSPEPMPAGCLPPGFENKVMHSSFKVGDNVIMASDGCGEPTKFDGFSLSIAVPTEAEVDRIFAALSNGGTVVMPATKTFWSPKYGMVKDKFGVMWMVSVVPAAK